MRTTTAALFFAVSTLSTTTAFQGATTPTLRSAAGALPMAATPEEDRALAMSNYLARAHEEKLKAVQAAEEKHEKEISELKAEIKRLKEHEESRETTSSSMIATGTGTSASDLMALSKEELANRIVSYQKYLAKYIVEAQEAKLLAVREAVASTNKKWAEKQLQLAPAASSNLFTDRKPEKKASDTLFDKRNAAVAAAGTKSRWGDMEVQRAAAASQPAINGAAPAPPAVAAPSKPAVAIVVPPEVEAADHGLRADGGVGGLTLAERVSMGASAAAQEETVVAASPLATASKEQVLYEKRNSMVLAAAAAGKSRWGDQEIARVQNLPATSSLPAGGAPAAVKTMSLEDRVNLGAQILGR